MNLFTHPEVDDAISLVKSDKFDRASAIINGHIGDIEKDREKSGNDMHQLIKKARLLLRELRQFEKNLRAGGNAISFEPTKMIVEERLIQNYRGILNIALKLHRDYGSMAKESG